MNGPEQSVECVRLARTLRELRAATGLSLAALAARTPYSKSSWERYLNGKALPPRSAVEQLCALADERPARALALWDLAESTWSGRADGDGRRQAAEDAGSSRAGEDAGSSQTGEAAVPGAAPGRGHRRSVGYATGVFGGLAAVTAGVLLAVWGLGGGGQPAEGAAAPNASAPGPSCTGAACTGKDPEATRCASGVDPPGTVAEHRFDGGTVVKVRRSVPCGTVWARIDRGERGDRVEVAAPRAKVQRREVRDRFDAQGSLSTPMAVAASADLSRVRACLVRDGARECFGDEGDEGDKSDRSDKSDGGTQGATSEPS
ncbi:helix-turn-helix domain-containing protein [Streptomyces sp. E11-3]|uniref:helix-turn-helix domain-containing protein n=1 Tax=Streptomyces sp. E11-3 TaxID=3110112 RepID=UPI00397F3354